MLLNLTDAVAQEKQLIIRIPNQTESSIIAIGKQLNCLEGLHFSGYVKNASCLLLRYDAATIKDVNIITTTLHHLNKKLNYEVVRGMTAFDVIDGKLPYKKMKLQKLK
jgi:hypothetical protein